MSATNQRIAMIASGVLLIVGVLGMALHAGPVGDGAFGLGLVGIFAVPFFGEDGR